MPALVTAMARSSWTSRAFRRVPSEDAVDAGEEHRVERDEMSGGPRARPEGVSEESMPSQGDRGVLHLPTGADRQVGPEVDDVEEPAGGRQQKEKNEEGSVSHHAEG